MSKALKRKFGVKQIIGESRQLTCIECGQRAGLHYGSKCPIIDLKTGKPFKMNTFRKQTIAAVKKMRGLK